MYHAQYQGEYIGRLWHGVTYPSVGYAMGHAMIHILARLMAFHGATVEHTVVCPKENNHPWKSLCALDVY